MFSMVSHNRLRESAWDFAAAQLVLEEVGGRCTNHQGEPLLLTHRDTVCSRNGVHDEVIEALGAIAAAEPTKQ
jgi:fructose-1,6-bisphosphatase/inositol monophosphatase family enzyme